VGILRNLRKRFGDMMKIVFGKNSAIKSIIAVEMRVLTNRTRKSDCKTGVRIGFRVLVKTKP
jgi:ribosomal protein S20